MSSPLNLKGEILGVLASLSTIPVATAGVRVAEGGDKSSFPMTSGSQIVNL